jgi:23S rRNA pseudouridine1911/1915/1917 synthase
VDKPPFVLSHPCGRNRIPNLLGELRKERPTGYLALVNRLDRETSGLLVIAKDPAASSILGRLWEKRIVRKEYLAIVFGAMRPGHKWVVQTPLGPVGFSESNPVAIRQGPQPHGGWSHTEIQALAVAGNFSLVRVRPKTGRLHQIRVHLSLLGFPIVGDKIYGPDSRLFLEFIQAGWTETLAKRLLLPRQALHACAVGFWWRGIWRWIEIGLPPDLEEFWRSQRPRETASSGKQSTYGQ